MCNRYPGIVRGYFLSCFPQWRIGTAFKYCDDDDMTFVEAGLSGRNHGTDPPIETLALIELLAIIIYPSMACEGAESSSWNFLL